MMLLFLILFVGLVAADQQPLICADTTVIQNAFINFGPGLGSCTQIPIGGYYGYNCQLTGLPQRPYIWLRIVEGNRKFAASVTATTKISGYTVNTQNVDCVTCNKTEYANVDTRKCNAVTYYTTTDLDKGAFCLADTFPTTGIVTNSYYYQLPLNNQNVQMNSNIDIDFSLGEKSACKVTIRIFQMQ